MWSFSSELIAAIAAHSEWAHRKVVQIQFTHGTRGIVRTSLDCTIPPSPKLAYEPRERRMRRISKVNGGIIAPITRLEKAPLHNFSISLGDGTPVPILLREEYSDLLTDALVDAISAFRSTPSRRAAESLWRLVGGDPDVAQENFEALQREPSMAPILGDQARSDVSGLLRNIIHDLVHNYWLLAVVPANATGNRTIVKWTNHFEVQVKDAHTRAQIHSYFVGSTAPLAIPSLALSETKSFHLEVIAPPFARISRIELPETAHAPTTRTARGDRDVAHAYGRYGSDPDEDITVELRTSPQPARQLGVVSWLMAVQNLLAAILPNASNALASNSDAATSLFLVPPAMIVATLALARESVATRKLLRPLRTTATILGGLSIAVAASYAGGLISPLRTSLHLAVGVLALLVGSMTLLAPAWMKRLDGTRLGEPKGAS